MIHDQSSNVANFEATLTTVKNTIKNTVENVNNVSERNSAIIDTAFIKQLLDPG